jgi:hypothetical protein
MIAPARRTRTTEIALLAVALIGAYALSRSLSVNAGRDRFLVSKFKALFKV